MPPSFIFLAIVAVFFLICYLNSGNNPNFEDSEYLPPDLVNAARGDRALAKSLLKQMRLKYPNKSESWYVEKIIYDLKREAEILEILQLGLQQKPERIHSNKTIVAVFLLNRDLKSGNNPSCGDSDYLAPDLVSAARGDRALAKRLLKQMRLKYPGKSESWYVEKVIYDLKRETEILEILKLGLQQKPQRTYVNKTYTKDIIIEGYSNSFFK